MEAVALTIAGKALTTIFGTGSKISDLLGIITAIKDYVDSNQGMVKVIDKAINKANQKAGRTNDLGMRPSNSQLTEFVINKTYDNDYIPQTNWFRDDEFDVFYNTLINDKTYWGILQDLLTEHRLQIIDNREKDIQETSTSIQEKVDKLIAQIKTVVIAIEKAILPIVELRPYYPLDKELFITQEEDMSLYRDKFLIDKIHQNLDSRHVYLIQSSEGRGKTTLCRIIASDYYSEDTKVYFIDLKSNVEIDKIRKCCIELNNTKAKTLLVLENIHATGDLEALVSLINTYKADLRFLLNARPTESEYATYLKDLGEDNIFDLRPLRTYCKRVARCLCKDKPISEGDLSSFISKRIYSKIYANQQNAGANLRLLRIYCSVWNEGNYGSILNIREHDILEKFKSIYDLKNAKKSEKNALLYLSCMYQFDVPLQEELLTNEEYDGLQSFCNNGLCTFFDFDGKFYMPHSVDASYLSKAIGGRQYKEKTQAKILDFVNRILNYKTPRSFESDFLLLISGMKEKNTEFAEVIKALTQWDLAEQIIEKIDPAFVITAFDTRYTDASAEEVKAIYTKNKESLRERILELPPLMQNNLTVIFNKYLKLERVFVNDIFVDLEELNTYIDKYLPRRSAWIRVWRELCEKDEFRKALEERVPVGGFLSPVQYEYYFNSKKKKGASIVNNDTYTGYVYKLKPTNFDNFVYTLHEKGFCFEGLNWRRLCGYLGKMAYCINENNRPYFQAVAQTMVEMVLDKNQEFLEQPNALRHATSEQLSDFLYYLKRIDKTIYGKTVLDDKVVEVVKARFDEAESIGLDELSLFAHFYGKSEFDYNVHELVEKAKPNIENTNENDFSKKLGFINNRNQSLYGELVGDQLIIENVQKRLKGLASISFDGLYLFSRFYSQNWCKDEINLLIDGANEEQVQVIKEWHDKAMVGIEKRRKEGEVIKIEGLLAYIHNKFYDQEE